MQEIDVNVVHTELLKAGAQFGLDHLFTDAAFGQRRPVGVRSLGHKHDAAAVAAGFHPAPHNPFAQGRAFRFRAGLAIDARGINRIAAQFKVAVHQRKRGILGDVRTKIIRALGDLRHPDDPVNCLHIHKFHLKTSYSLRVLSGSSPAHLPLLYYYKASQPV